MLRETENDGKEPEGGQRDLPWFKSGKSATNFIKLAFIKHFPLHKCKYFLKIV